MPKIIIEVEYDDKEKEFKTPEMVRECIAFWCQPYIAVTEHKCPDRYQEGYEEGYDEGHLGYARRFPRKVKE